MTMLRHVVVVVALASPAAPALAQQPPPVLPPPDVLFAQAPPPAEGARQRGEAARERQRRIEELRQQRRERLTGPQLTEMFSRTLMLGRTGTFELTNPSGDIVLTGGRGDELRIEAVKRAQQQDEAQAKALLQGIEIQISERSGLVEVRTLLPRARNWAGGVDYTITLPDTANVVIRAVSGDVRLTNVRGDLRTESVSGDIIAADVRRVRVLRTVSGDIQLTDAEAQDLSAGSVSGDVVVQNLKAEAVTLESVSGDARLTDVESTRARLRSVSGDIEYRGQLTRGGRYEFESHSGSILVNPTRGGFDVDISSFSGDVRSDVQLRTTRPADDPPGGRRNRSIRGTVGDAGAIVTARSFSGDVTIGNAGR